MMHEKISCTEARQMDLVQFLGSLGYHPQRISRSDYWYLSPLRQERTASFKVDRKLNLWYDHGIGKGGTLIDFSILYFNCSVGELLLRLSADLPVPASMQQPSSLAPTVNKGGQAPVYWYLKSKGHEPMYYPEEKVPAWRLSEIGLTPESSGTATGHRGIFMSCFAPWMLRTGYYTKDSFLINLAKASLVGRSTNFPGYHINTERTTAYEKPDFPLHEHKKQSVNSFHYNHILPMASLFMDYLVSDAYARSRGKIDFPNEYIEGYAYLQNKFYGHAKGKFYNYSNVQLWMPARLVKSESVELNYVAGRNGDVLLLAFTNQSSAPVTTTITLNPKWLQVKGGAALQLLSEEGSAAGLKDSSFVVTVPANGLTALAITPVAIASSFQSKLLTSVKDSSRDFASIQEGKAKAMLFKLGGYGRRLFVYLEDDDNTWKKAQLVYTDATGKKKTIEKAAYPFEFTADVDLKKPVRFSLVLTGTDGKVVRSKTVELGK